MLKTSGMLKSLLDLIAGIFNWFLMQNEIQLTSFMAISIKHWEIWMKLKLFVAINLGSFDGKSRLQIMLLKQRSLRP